MSASAPSTCPLGLTPDDLSAWRDHMLSPEDERRIAAHTTACPACQRTIAAHTALAAALRAEPAPAPDPRNWSTLQARINGAPRLAPAIPALPRAQRPAIWGGLSAAVAVVLLSALFFHLFAQQAGVRGGASRVATPTVIATPQALRYVTPTAPIVGPQVSWQSHMIPDSLIPTLGIRIGNTNIAVAPTDAQTAYICFTRYASHPSSIAVWATHDGSRTWTHVSDLPTPASQPDCSINVDAHDPLRVNVVNMNQGQPMSEDILSSISDDGGKTWRTLSDKVSLEQLATRGETSVAIASPLTSIPNTTKTQPPHLVISHDGFRTWSPIDGQFTAQGQFVGGVWQRPSDGALLAVVETQHTHSQTLPNSSTPIALPDYYTWALWTSADDGSNWTRFPTPPNLTGFPGYLVAQPVGSSPWTVCALSTPDGGDSIAVSDKELIGCTHDGGKTWASLPLPAIKVTCGDGCPQRQPILMQDGSWLMNDGSLVVMMYADTTSAFHILRLQPGSAQWQDLGPTPGNALMAIDSTPKGTLVNFEGGSFVSVNGPTSGSIIGQLGGGASNRGVLAIATLP